MHKCLQHGQYRILVVADHAHDRIASRPEVTLNSTDLRREPISHAHYWMHAYHFASANPANRIGPEWQYLHCCDEHACEAERDFFWELFTMHSDLKAITKINV